jgi:TPR repeat protein
MAMMGILYRLGLGVPQDKVLAYMWLNLSVASGQQKAAKERSELANEMTREQIADAEKMAREWAAQHPLE